MPIKASKTTSSGGILGRALENFNLRKSRDSAGFNGFLSLGKKQTASNGQVNIFGMKVGQ
jgi:hypothetical protein